LILQEIYNILDRISSFSFASSWDNSGINIGYMEQYISEIVISLDVDSYILDNIKSNTLLITHHPLIFTPIKSIQDDPISNLIKKMIKKDIAHIAMHTNFDKTHLNSFVAINILGFDDIYTDDFVCYINIKPTTFDDILELVVDRFHIYCPNIVRTSKPISKIALTTGSGGSLINKVNADLFLTGDIKYHDAMYAKERGLGLIDITHFASEIFFSEALLSELRELNIKISIINSNNPFSKE